ncbi:DUF6538 domain-containing protein [Martelella soudanensis]|uniref:DUF6538 domain-containing protein n=1 Tax=unclassified Martelella TaxID=2629616 RepID=UPI00353046FA
MSGPWRHPRFGIFYFRRDTPSDLKRGKTRLKALGIKYRGEVHRSLQTRDPKEAQRRYPKSAMRSTQFGRAGGKRSQAHLPLSPILTWPRWLARLALCLPVWLASGWPCG